MVHRAGLAILRQQCGQRGDSQRSIPWHRQSEALACKHTWGRADMQTDRRAQLWVSALDTGIMQTCRHIQAEQACHRLERQASPDGAAGQAASKDRHRQRGCQPSARPRTAAHAARSRMFSTAGCGVAASGGCGQHRRVSPTVQLGGRRGRTHCRHTVAPATFPFTSRSPLGRRHRNPQAPARAGATTARRTNRWRWSPCGPYSGPL